MFGRFRKTALINQRRFKHRLNVYNSLVNEASCIRVVSGTLKGRWPYLTHGRCIIILLSLKGVRRNVINTRCMCVKGCAVQGSPEAVCIEYLGDLCRNR